MSPQERDELMEFILQSQSNAAETNREMSETHRKIMEEHREIMGEHRGIMKGLQQNTTQIEALVVASHDLVEVARIHSRRLDRLEGLSS